MTDLHLSTWFNNGKKPGAPAFPDAPELGSTPHAETAMKHLGIEYAEAQPMPIGDCWVFRGCTNVPDQLPSWLRIIKDTDT